MMPQETEGLISVRKQNNGGVVWEGSGVESPCQHTPWWRHTLGELLL